SSSRGSDASPASWDAPRRRYPLTIAPSQLPECTRGPWQNPGPRTGVDGRAAGRPGDPDSAHGEHDVDDRVDHDIDLRLLVAAALGREGDGAQFLDAERPAGLEVGGDAVGELIDLAHPVAQGEDAHAAKAMSARTHHAIQDHLRGLARLQVPG